MFNETRSCFMAEFPLLRLPPQGFDGLASALQVSSEAFFCGVEALTFDVLVFTPGSTRASA